MPEHHPDVSIIVVADGPWAATYKCLTALLEPAAGVSRETIVVDDGTTDETPLALPRLEGITALRADEPRGFCRAANAGASAARGRYLYFLHCDAEPQPGWLSPLLALAESDPTVMVVASRLVTPDGAIESEGIAFAYASPYPLTPVAHGGGAPALPSMDTLIVPAAPAVALLVRADDFRRAQGFDAGHGAVASALDLCLRIGAQGGQVLVARNSTVIHQGSCQGDIADRDAAWLTRHWMGKVPLLDPAGRRERPAPPPRRGRPAISVVVPVRNALGTVALCLEGLRRNLGPDDELIIADAGSDDGSGEFAALFARQPGVEARVLLGGPAGGLEGALRGGLNAATRPVTVLFHPETEPPDGFLDALSALVEPVGAPSSVATPTTLAGTCMLGPTTLLRAIGSASPDAFLATNPGALVSAVAAQGGRLGLVEQTSAS